MYTQPFWRSLHFNNIHSWVYALAIQMRFQPTMGQTQIINTKNLTYSCWQCICLKLGLSHPIVFHAIRLVGGKNGCLLTKWHPWWVNSNVATRQLETLFKSNARLAPNCMNRKIRYKNCGNSVGINQNKDCQLRFSLRPPLQPQIWFELIRVASAATQLAARGGQKGASAEVKQMGPQHWASLQVAPEWISLWWLMANNHE